MSNQFYEDKMYNPDRKEEFMSDYSEGTRKSLNRLFKVSQEFESDLGKDLHDFNIDELRRLLFRYMPKTAYSSKANATWIHKYISWAEDEGYKKSPLNPLDMVDTEWKEQFAIKSNIKTVWTKEEIDQIIKTRANAQDAVIILLLFEGVRGTGNSEVLNLMKHDIDEEKNTLHLFDETTKERRYLEVSDKCIALCLRALREQEYDKMNGNASKDIKSPTAQLVSSNYVVRSAMTNTKFTDVADSHIVHRRLSKIADELNLPNLTPSSIYNSGMIYYAAELIKESGKLDEEEYKLIFEKFYEPSEQTQYRIKNEFLNLANIKTVYELS